MQFVLIPWKDCRAQAEGRGLLLMSEHSCSSVQAFVRLFVSRLTSMVCVQKRDHRNDLLYNDWIRELPITYSFDQKT